jgi:hypothetical protein
VEQPDKTGTEIPTKALTVNWNTDEITFAWSPDSPSSEEDAPPESVVQEELGTDFPVEEEVEEDEPVNPEDIMTDEEAEDLLKETIVNPDGNIDYMAFVKNLFQNL